MEQSIVTIGMFDGVHIGHRHILHTLLEEGSRRGLRPCLFTFDRHPRQVIYGDDELQLLNTFDERMSFLRSAEGLDVVVVPFTKELARMSACDFFMSYMRHKADIKALLLGYDNSFGNKRDNDLPRLRDLLRERSVAVLDDVPVLCHGVEVSSTKIRQALLSGDVSLANEMLG